MRCVGFSVKKRNLEIQRVMDFCKENSHGCGEYLLPKE